MTKPKSKDLPWSKIYWADLWVHTDHLTDTEFGRLMRLKALAWVTGGGSLPMDEKWIARKFDITVEELQQTILPLLKHFFKKSRTLWKDIEQTDHKAAIDKKRKTAIAAAKTRWGNENEPCNRIPDAMPNREREQIEKTDIDKTDRDDLGERDQSHIVSSSVACSFPEPILIKLQELRPAATSLRSVFRKCNYDSVGNSVIAPDLFTVQKIEEAFLLQLQDILGKNVRIIVAQRGGE